MSNRNKNIKPLTPEVQKVEKAELTELEKAQQVINEANKKRLAEFEQKLQALCQDYGVHIEPKVELLIVPNN